VAVKIRQMAAVAALHSSAHRRGNQRSSISVANSADSRQQVSFHLKLIDKDIDLKLGSQSSVQYLRQAFGDHATADNRADPEPWTKSEISHYIKKPKSKNPANVLLEVWVQKLTLSNDVNSAEAFMWQPRLLVLTNKSLFILREGMNEDLEIVDSIPIHDVNTAEATATIEIARSHSNDSRLSRIKSVAKPSLISTSLTNLSYEDDAMNPSDKYRRMTEKYDRLLLLANPNLGCLRITTISEGLNDGRPYYFLFGQISDCNDARNESIKELALLITKLSKTQKQIVAIEDRFRRFQDSLQIVWQSPVFNILIMALIASNFVFTVRGMESKNPDDNAFFERVDLIYTVIFALGGLGALLCPSFSRMASVSNSDLFVVHPKLDHSIN
jgi:hypothetical protein